MIIPAIAIYIIGMIMISVFGSKGNVFAVIVCTVGIIVLRYTYYNIIHLLADGNSARNKSN